MDPLLDQLTRGLGSAYRIERELGGGMSRVFLATELALGRRVVLKVLPPDLARDVSAERFKREISLAASLQHAHIVPLLTAGHVDGVPWFTMPLVDGHSLRSRLSSGELPIPEAVRLLRDVASALAYAHAKGVVHRDIKPENILIADGSAFVSDFGVSKAVTEAGAEKGVTFTSVGVALGTPAYMAPEQIAADKAADHRGDLYSFGVVAYEVLTGRNPFAGRSMQQTMAAHMTETPPPVETQRAATPPGLAQLVNRCLAKSPADRPQKAQELVDTLDALTTPTGSLPMTGVPGVATGRRWVAPAVAAAVLVVATGGWLAWRSSRGVDFEANRVAVLPFTNLTGDTALAVIGRVAAEELSRNISQTDSANVVATTAIDAALGGASADDADAVLRVARATRASVIVVGSYSRVRDSIRMQARLVDARTGSVTRALDPTTASIADPMPAIEGLRERLLGSLVSGDVARRVSLTTTAPKYSAYLEYMAGVRMFMRNQAQSRPFFERAIALDSTFVLPYGVLATTYTNAGMWERAEEVVDRLEAQRARLSSYERRYLDWARAHNDYVADDILVLAQEMYARSGDPVFSYLVGFWALRVLKPDVALAALQISDSVQVAVGWIGQVRDMAIARHQLADYDGEVAELKRGMQVLPQFAGFYRNSLLRAYAGLGDSASAAALADTLLGGEAGPNQLVPFNAVHNGAREFEAHGDTATARRLRLMNAAWMHAHPTATPSFARDNALGFMWFDLGNADSAATHLRRAAADTGNAAVTAVGYIGVLSALRGDSARARAVADSLAGQRRKWDFGLSVFWRAAIVAELGQRDVALGLLRQARQRGQSMAAWHYHTALRSLRGYAPFEEMITPQR